MELSIFLVFAFYENFVFDLSNFSVPGKFPQGLFFFVIWQVMDKNIAEF